MTWPIPDWCPAPGATLADIERAHIVRVLTDTHGNKQEAARVLGIARGTLYRKMHDYGIVVATVQSCTRPESSCVDEPDARTLVNT